MPPNWANLVHPLYKKGDWANPDNWRPIVCATTEAKLIWMLILKQVAPAVYRAVPPTMWGAIPGRSPLEAIFMQDAVVDMDPISLIITSLDVKGAFPNAPLLLLRAIWEHMGLPFQGFLQAYLATRMYAIKTGVGTTPWVHPTSGVPQGGTEGPFLFLLVTLPLAFYIPRTYPDVATYPLRTTLLAFADDMAVVTATARQPLPTSPDPTRATKGLHVVTTYLEGNQLLVHNVKSVTIVHNAPPPPLRPEDLPMNPVNTATYLGVQQAATAGGVTLPPNLIRQLTRTLVIARITAPSTQALAYFLQAVLNAAIGFQALHLTHPQHMLQAATTTVRRAWTIHGHRPTSLPATVRAASPPYYGDSTDRLVNNAYTAHTAAHLHRLMHNHEPEVREVFTLTLREAQYHRKTCPQYILHQRGLPTNVGTRIWNHLQLLLPHHTTSSKLTIGAGKLALWHSFTLMWGVDQRGAPPLWTWWAPPSTSCGSPQTRCKPSNEWAHTTSHSYNTRSGQTNQSWRTTCAVRPPKPDTPNQKMGRYVRRTTCFGTRTNRHCRRAHREGTRPTAGHRSKWNMCPVPRCPRCSSLHPTGSRPRYGRAGQGAIYGSYRWTRGAPSVRRHYRKTS